MGDYDVMDEQNPKRVASITYPFVHDLNALFLEFLNAKCGMPLTTFHPRLPAHFSKLIEVILSGMSDIYIFHVTDHIAA